MGPVLPVLHASGQPQADLQLTFAGVSGFLCSCGSCRYTAAGEATAAVAAAATLSVCLPTLSLWPCSWYVWGML